MKIHVFVNGHLLVTESNPEFARPYWARQQLLRPELSIRLVEVPA